MGLFSDYLSVRAFGSIVLLMVGLVVFVLFRQNKLTRISNFLLKLSPGVRTLIYLVFIYIVLKLASFLY
jgi:hypothetical protein